MNEKLTLYRGDFSKIKQFDIKKTSTYCLVGQGVYLTDSLRVAESYRTKDSSLMYKDDILFTGEADNRTEALKLALLNMVCYKQDEKYRQLYSKHINRDRFGSAIVKEQEILSILMPIFQQKVEEGKVVISYIGANRRSKILSVRLIPDVKHGYISEFEFLKKDFETKMFNIDTTKDQFFFELMYENGIPFGELHPVKEEYISINTDPWKEVEIDRFTSLSQRNRLFKYRKLVDLLNIKDPFVFNSKTNIYRRIEKILKNYGYLGFEYKGGFRIGGHGTHRAFCVWSDDYVNEHAVNRFR